LLPCAYNARITAAHPSSAQANIWKLYAIQACTQALFAIPVIVLFWQSYGLNLHQIMLLQAAFAFAVFVLEIPTGYLADRWGRRNTLVLGCTFGFAAYLVYATGTGFWQFLVAELLVGTGSSLLSGTIEAMTYDSLLELKREREYRRIAGNQAFLEFNTEAVSGIAGGVLGAVSLALPLWVTTLPMGLAVLTALSLHEPVRHNPKDNAHLRTIARTAAHALLKHPGLRMVILVYGLISSLSLMLFWFFQPYQTLVGVPVALFGLTHAITVVAGACSAKAVPWFERRADDRLLLVIPAAMAVCCYLALALPPAAPLLLCFLISRLAWHFVGPLSADLINRMTTSDVRATVLSVRSFFSRLLFLCASPFVGALADARDIPYTLLVFGLGGSALLGAALFFTRDGWRQIPA
jgi:MFS family permease